MTDLERLRELANKAARERRYDLRTPIIRAIYDVMQAIEACGASVELTRAVTLAGELMEPTRLLLEERDALLDRLQAAEQERDKAHRMTGLAIEDYNDEKARADAAERDAVRYRWLRERRIHRRPENTYGPASCEMTFQWDYDCWPRPCDCSPERMDRALDAAQGAQDTPGDA